MTMRFADCERNIRRYIDVKALLTHVIAHQVQPSIIIAYSASFTEKLVQRVNCSQAAKWRKYAQSENDRTHGSARMDIS